MTRIELAYSVWKTAALPLSYIRVGQGGSGERSWLLCWPMVLPPAEGCSSGSSGGNVPAVRFERTTSGFSLQRSDQGLSYADFSWPTYALTAPGSPGWTSRRGARADGSTIAMSIRSRQVGGHVARRYWPTLGRMDRGACGIRTHGLLPAEETRYRLRQGPMVPGRGCRPGDLMPFRCAVLNVVPCPCPPEWGTCAGDRT